MKKAKQYATEILEAYVNHNEAEVLKVAAASIKDLFAEVDEIQKARKAVQYRALLNILKEQHIKWLSICRIVNKEINILNEGAFLGVVEAKMTMIYPNLMAIIEPSLPQQAG